MSLLKGYFTISFDKRSSDKLSTLLVKEMSGEIRKKLKSNQKQITSFVRSIVRQNLMNSPEAQSIIDDNGRLRIELGLKNGASDIVNIVDQIVSKTNIEFDESGTPSKEIQINIKIYLEGEYVDLYSKSYSSYATKNGVKIEWLNWLLEAGNSDVIFGYKIKYGIDIGRTGEAIMMPSKTANWRVPPEFSGTAENNFITRSFEGVDQELLKFIGGIIT